MNVRGSDMTPELLSPAGNWDCARAAVAAGADAIYFGLPMFNARLTYSDKFCINIINCAKYYTIS